MVDFYGKLVGINGINIPFSMGILCMGSQHKTSSGLGRERRFLPISQAAPCFMAPFGVLPVMLNANSLACPPGRASLGPVWGVGCGVLHT